MIQRIQTLWLLIVVALTTAMMFMPLAMYGGGVEEYKLYAFGMHSSQDSFTNIPIICMSVLIVLTLLIPLFTIFLFKRRQLQIRMCVVEMILLVGSQVVICIIYIIGYRAVADFDVHGSLMKPAMFIPVIAIFFSYLAMKAISRDEILVRSTDRIR